MVTTWHWGVVAEGLDETDAAAMVEFAEALPSVFHAYVSDPRYFHLVELERPVVEWLA